MSADDRISLCFTLGVVACAVDQYSCLSGQCVSDALRCDGYADCRDRSDEAYCARPPHCPTQLRCPGSHQCLEKEWLCDGEDDCKDGSDEKVRHYSWEGSILVLMSKGNNRVRSPQLIETVLFSGSTRLWELCLANEWTEAMLLFLVRLGCSGWNVVLPFVYRTASRRQQSAGNTSGSVEPAVNASLCHGGVTGGRIATTAWTRPTVSNVIAVTMHLFQCILFPTFVFYIFNLSYCTFFLWCTFKSK